VNPYQIGDVKVHLLSDSSYYTDAGAMFGIIPKPVWSRHAKTDRRGRVPLAVNCYLIQTRRHNILVDTGLGNKLNPTWRDRYAVKKDGRLVEELAGVGLSPDDVDFVVLSHLHFDHAGGATTIDEEGVPRIAFPKATYYIQRRDWLDATHPNERTRGGYQPEDFLPLKEAGRLRLLEGDHYITKNVSIVVTGGHTTAHQIVRISSRHRLAYFPGDIVPTAAYVTPAYATAYDLYPLTTLDWKKTILRRAVRRRALLFLPHEIKHPVGLVELDENKRYVYKPVEPGEEPAPRRPKKRKEK
jgi:glyoxylase-like metal-dependent hydrolase (beta-lactamase superfamily II)